MFYLHVSNRTENLLRHLVEVIRTDKQQDAFAVELFLIQSQGMERMIAQTLADEFQSFCNYKFFLPLEFLEFISKRLGMGLTSDGFQRQILTWRLEELLRDISREAYPLLFSYLSGDNSDLKRFQLARRLANIFDQYQLMRPDMLMQWERGLRTCDHVAEDWQAELWQKLLAQQGGNVHRGILFNKVIALLGGEKNFTDLLPKRISIIGLHTIPPIFLQYLNNLARHMDIHLMLLSPCRNYWGNVLSRRAYFKQSGHLTPDQVEGDQEHHPLLAVLGRQGRDLQNLMLEHAEFAMDFSSYEDPLGGKRYCDGTLLQRLQADLLEGVLPEGRDQDFAADDNSIQLISCHSKLREIAILKDHLLHLLHLDPQLELRDIIVMAPDIQEYASIIPAVFADIQHSIADRSVRRRNSVIAAFSAFFDLFTGRFGWSEILDLLRKPIICPQFDLSVPEIDTLQQWVIRSGIRWGLSGQQRAESGLPDFDETSWRAGLEGLLLGYAIAADDFIDGILPFKDIEGRGALPLGGLCRFIELIENCRKDFAVDLPLGDWSKLLLSVVQQLFGDTYEQELVELRSIISEAEELVSPFHKKPVSFAVIREWFQQSVKESRSSTGFLRGQLTFCSMLPMRSIPFQVVCLLGLNDGSFPKNDGHDTFDLMSLDVRAGDRSPRADDRYQFLEALLAARSHLYISYIGQSIKTNEMIPPSVVVTEFLEVLESAYGVKDLADHHPLHPFSRKYFITDGNARLFSYDSYCCRTAEILQRGTQPVTDWWQGSIDRGQLTVHWADLLRFYAHPQKYFVKNCLGIRLDQPDDLPDEREIFELSGLETYQVDQLLIQSALNGEMDNEVRKLQTIGLWPLGSSGRLVYESKKFEVARFLQKVNDQQMGKRCADLPLDLELELEQGSFRISGRLSNLYENGAMLIRYGRLRGRDLMLAHLHHCVLCLLQPLAITRLVADDLVVVFSGDDTTPNLDALYSHFVEGCQAPSAFLVEPALAYARQLAGSRGKNSPLEKASQVFTSRLQNGYEPEWQLLYTGQGEQPLLGETFEQLCQQLMCPIWSAVNG